MTTALASSSRAHLGCQHDPASMYPALKHIETIDWGAFWSPYSSIFPRIWDWGTFLVFSSSIPRVFSDGPGPAQLRPHHVLRAQRWTEFSRRTLESNMAREIHRWIWVCLKMMHIPSFMAIFNGEMMINHCNLGQTIVLDKAASIFPGVAAIRNS